MIVAQNKSFVFASIENRGVTILKNYYNIVCSLVIEFVNQETV